MNDINMNNTVKEIILDGEDATKFLDQYLHPKNTNTKKYKNIHLKRTKQGFEVTIDGLNLNIIDTSSTLNKH